MRYWFSHSFSSAFIWVQGGQPTKQGQQIRMLLKVARQTDLGCFPLGNKINKWSQREDKFSSVYGTVLHAEYKAISFIERDWALKKGIFNSRLVGFWKRLRKVSNGPPGTSTAAKGFQKSSWWELPNSSTPAKCNVHELFTASSSIAEPPKPSMAWLSFLAAKLSLYFFPLRKGELGSILCLSVDNRNVRL